MRAYKLGDDPLAYAQIFGERNSATTYLSKLIQDNLHIPTNVLGLAPSDETPFGHKIFGYKHWFINWKKLEDPRQRQTLFLVIYRNPYTWIRAMMERPYALERSLSGKCVEELPNVKLAGHINGKDTENEFDPETGAPLTIFELRRQKIAHFEALNAKVNNIAFLNLEEFLDNPPAVIERLAQTYPSAFRKELKFDRAPYRILMKEHLHPKTFKPSEQAVLDEAIDWTAESVIGYEPGNYGLRKKAVTQFIVLHGGSGVGKTYLMERLVAAGDRFIGLEMDACKYWLDDANEFAPDQLHALLPEISEDEIAAFEAIVERLSAKGNRCVAYLLDTLATLDHPRTVIATCGALPDPEDASIYAWLAERLPVAFHHVLIDIPQERHIAQIEKRGRSHLKDDILRHHTKKIAKHAQHDIVISDLTGAAQFVSQITGQNITTTYDTPASPNLRIHKSGLRYIQIYGERNSGTKYLKQLIAENARAPERIMGAYATKTDPVNKARMIGYKHYYPRLDKLAKHQHETLFLVIYKNPYTWVRSMLAKPYHFKACLAGKSILDLPEIKLAGTDIHGRAIPDVHPETGERITMFDLRRYKIEAWEALKAHASNVVYVNYENLLVSPTPILQRITDEFSFLFASTNAPVHEPDPHYIRKYVNPTPFEPEEMATMNDHINWEVEAVAGYTCGNLFIPDRGLGS